MLLLPKMAGCKNSGPCDARTAGLKPLPRGGGGRARVESVASTEKMWGTNE